MREPFPAAAAAKLKKLSHLRPTLAIVLGSGFHHVFNEMEVAAQIAYAKLPGFPPVGVSGHAGQLLIGRLGGTEVMVLTQPHLIEDIHRAYLEAGSDIIETDTFNGTRLSLSEFGLGEHAFELNKAAAEIARRAAGGVNSRFRAGDFMLLADHINLMGTNPLRGAASPGLPRFVDLTRTYDSDLGRLMERAARKCGVKLRRGVYLALSGPSYETPAEIRAFARLGADAVGMSTVPEAIVARQAAVRVAGLSCITNLAAGLGKGPLSHAEVLETGERVKNLAAQLLKTFCLLYGHNH